MRILVCGGRDYDDWDTVCHVLKECETSVTLIIEGGAIGADKLGMFWAIDNGVQHVCYPADWKTHGKAAGPIRNQWMLDEGKPDLVVAFPGGTGTADMVKRAKKAGIQVREVK